MSVVAEVDRQVSASLRRAGLAHQNATLVVGVSGGADSSTLLYSLDRIRASCGINLHVAHLNHDFRGEEADEDARFVAELARRLGLPATVEKRDPIAYQRQRGISSFEQGARELRYNFLASVAHTIDAPAVAVGHTSDDLAETVLLHILRGSGLHGLRGMTEVAPWPWPTGLEKPVLFRPLLEVSKAETVAFCRELGRAFREDSGNSLFRFTRNRVRQSLMPMLAADYNPQVRSALVRLARTSSLELDYLEQELNGIWQSLLIPVGESEIPEESGALVFNRSELAELHPALRRLALRRAYVDVKGDPRRLRENHLQAMSDLVERGRSGGSLDLPGGLKLRLQGKRVILSGEPVLERIPFPKLESIHRFKAPVDYSEQTEPVGHLWTVTAALVDRGSLPELEPPNPYWAYLAPDKLGAELTVRSRQPGDRFQPLGLTGTKKLKDFFTDNKVPRNRRDGIPLLVSAGEIAWVVGYRIAAWAKVPADCPPEAPVLVLTFEPLT